MTGDVEVEPVAAGAGRLSDLVAMFEAYREHYGGPPAPERAEEWLRAHLADRRLLGFVAYADGQPAGMAVVAPSPMSQRLGTAWGLRDLYVDAAHRRAGVARALLDAVTSAARAAGALRVLLQTETDNRAARSLYESYGFTLIESHLSYSLPLD